MQHEPDLSVLTIAQFASHLAVPARTCMVVELMNGQALTATELATRAGIAPSTASEHLSLLVQGEILELECQGRHRYYRIASPSVAELVECMSALGMVQLPELEPRPLPSGIRLARTCYDHLAGYAGVTMRNAFLEHNFLCDGGDAHQITANGQRFFTDLGVDLDAVARARRSSSRRCLDWSERRYHIGGALGSAILSRLLTLEYLVAIPRERQLLVTSIGRDWFDTTLGVPLS